MDFFGNSFCALVMIAYIARRQPLSFLFNACIFFVIFYAASLVVPAIPDSRQYIAVSHKINSLQEALFHITGSYNPSFVTTAGLLFVARSIIGDHPVIESILVNCICVSALLYTPRLYFTNWRWQWNLSSTLCVGTLFALPSFMTLAVSANKDLIFLFYFLCFIFSLARLLEHDLSKGVDFVAILKSILLIIISFLAIKIIRNYILAIIVCSIFISLISFYLIKKLGKYKNRMQLLNQGWFYSLITLFIGFLILWGILVLKINEIRSVSFIYEGGSQINSLLYFTGDNLFFNTFLFGIYGFINYTFSCFYESFTNIHLEFSKKLICIFECSIFIFLLFINIIRKNKNILDIMILSIIIIHLGILSWSTPNIGALLRYRLMEIILMLFTYLQFYQFKLKAKTT